MNKMSDTTIARVMRNTMCDFNLLQYLGNIQTSCKKETHFHANPRLYFPVSPFFCIF
jgi:hypothetical protein